MQRIRVVGEQHAAAGRRVAGGTIDNGLAATVAGALVACVRVQRIAERWAADKERLSIYAWHMCDYTYLSAVSAFATKLVQRPWKQQNTMARTAAE